jgi:CubicO group peptidase (beta-lactamase class C family)
MSYSNDPRVQAALVETLERGEKGISVAVYHKGNLILHSVAGVADPLTGRPVDTRTLFPVFSVTKGVTALAVHLQAERGLLNLDSPICKYWPEFAANGKEGITIAHALCHRAGIPQMPVGVTAEKMADWDWMVDQIANHAPLFPPGSVNAYHVLVWGWILGEVVRRTDPAGRAFDVFVQEEICRPLQVEGFYLGVPDADLGRVATLQGGNDAPIVDESNIVPPEVFPGSNVHNLRVVQQCVDPGAGAIATAASIARIFAFLAEGGALDGVRLLSADRVKSFTQPRPGADEPDRVISMPTWVGAAGYYLGGKPGASSLLVGDHSEIIYSPGAGGSYAWADLRDRVAVAICHNNMETAKIVDPEPTYAPVVRAVSAIIADVKRQEG